jgi:hypothetical protein
MFLLTTLKNSLLRLSLNESKLARHSFSNVAKPCYCGDVDIEYVHALLI